MEALSGVASGMAVVSLTVQLLQSANAIKTFVRSVQNASKELERLVELLDCLSALLTDVCNIMERQASLQHCPLPPQTISDCLESCESSLGLLEEIAKRYERRQEAKASTMRKLKDDIKFSFKMQDITGLENRIQRDINNLNTALGTNATNIQLTTLSVLLQHEQASLTTTLSSHRNQYPMEILPRTPASFVSQQNMALISPKYGVNTKIRQQWLSSPLRRFGIYRRRLIRQTSVAKDQTDELGCTSHEVTSASYEVMWNLLGYGVYWSKDFPYGNISPSLRIFPVVESLRPYDELIETGTIQQIQQAFMSGVLHPFTKNQAGHTLLHWAARAARPDVCRLLLEYGVKAELSRYDQSPLMFSLNGFRRNANVDNHVMNQFRIDTLRLLLLEFDTIDDRDSTLWHLLTAGSLEFYGIMDLDMLEWFWIHAALAFHGTELVCFRAKLAQILVRAHENYFDENDNENHKLLVKLMDDQMVAEYIKGTYVLLPILVFNSNSVDSKRLGDAFLGLLASLNLDVDACVAMELERYPEGLLLKYNSDAEMRVIYEKHQTQGDILRWEWLYDPQAPGYHVVSEFNALAGDSYRYYEWPFHDFCEWEHTREYRQQRELKQTQRFNRRTARKARKGRARTGQKLPRSKMPGTWNW